MKIKSPHLFEILKYEHLLSESIKYSNIKALDALLHDDLQFVTPDGRTITKNMDLDAHKNGNMVVDKMETEIQSIHILNTTAIVILIMEAKGKMLGKPLQGKFKYLRVWQLMDNSWKVIGGSCTAIQSYSPQNSKS